MIGGFLSQLDKHVTCEVVQVALATYNSLQCTFVTLAMVMTSRNKNGSDSMGTLYRQPMGRLVLRYKKSKNLSGEAYV